MESGSGGRVDDAEFVAELFDLVLEAANRGVAGTMEGFELGGDVVTVDGEVVGDGDKLGEKGPGSDEEERGEPEDDNERSGWARQAEALELGDDGREQESEEDGNSKRKKKDLGEVKDGDGEYGDGEEPELRQKACGW